MTLFVNKPFKSHGGRELLFKIECDGLTDEDLETLAAQIARNLRFKEVISIPRGGDRLAAALRPHCVAHGATLVVDDVYTTGTSMVTARREYGTSGVMYLVLFSRGVCPSWIKVCFQMSSWLGP